MKVRFTDVWLRNLRADPNKRQMFTDASFTGLQLRVSPKGVKSFSLVYRNPVGGVTRETLGRYPDISLKDARDKAQEILDGLEEQAEEKEGLGTVEQLFTEVIATMRAAGMRSADDYEEVLLTGKRPAVDSFGRSTEARAVTPTMVTNWLRSYYVGVGSGMDHARASCSAAFGRGLKMDHDATRPANAMRYGLTGNPVSVVATAGSTGRTRNRVLSIQELRVIWNSLPRTAGPAMTAAFRLLIAMGGVRVTEVVESERSWWSLGDEPTLSLPDTKEHREHQLPITEPALPSLRLLLTLSEEIASGWEDRSAAPWLLPGFGKKQGPTVPITLSSVSKAARRLSTTLGMEHWQPRDIRRTMKTHLIDLGVSDVAVDVWHDHGKNADVARKHYDRATRWNIKKETAAGIEELLAHITPPLDGTPPPVDVSTLRQRAPATAPR